MYSGFEPLTAHKESHLGEKMFYIPPTGEDGMRDDEGATVYATESKLPNPYKTQIIKLPDLLTDEVKVFFPNRDSFYHFWLETATSVLAEIQTTDRNPEDWVGIIMVRESDVDEYNWEMIKFFCEKIKIHFGVEIRSYLVPSIPRTGAYEVNNAEFVYAPNYGVNAYKKLRQFIRSWSEIQPSDPNKRIYISRGKRDEGFFLSAYELQVFKASPDYVSFPGTYPRIDNEKQIENFLRERRVDIVASEDFKTFADQVAAYSSATTLISPTASGLLNMIFMPERSLVLELVTPMVDVYPQDEMKYLSQSYHNHYSLKAFASGHVYMAVPNDRVAHNLEFDLRELHNYLNFMC